MGATELSHEEVVAMLGGGLDHEQAKSIIRNELRVSRVMATYTEVKGRASSGKAKALCPLHNEKSPSLEIDDEKQVWFCHGCRAGGDIFTLVMEMESTTFAGAVRLLAEELGLKIKERLGRSTGVVEDRRTGRGTLHDGQEVTFILGPDRTPRGTLELADDEDGLIYGPQLWDRETLLRHQEQGRCLLLRTLEQVTRAADAGQPGVMLLGLDGHAQAQMLEAWGLSREAVLVAANRSHDADLEALVQSLSDGLRAGVPCFAARASDLDDPSRWADEQALLVRAQLERWSQDPQNVTELAWSLTRLRRRARDRDLFHHTPMRLQGLILQATGLEERFLQWQMREWRPFDPAALGRALGLPQPGANDAMLAAALWTLSQPAPVGSGLPGARLRARVTELLGERALPERSQEMLQVLAGERRLSAKRAREYRALRLPARVGADIPAMIERCAGTRLDPAAVRARLWPQAAASAAAGGDRSEDEAWIDSGPPVDWQPEDWSPGLPEDLPPVGNEPDFL